VEPWGLGFATPARMHPLVRPLPPLLLWCGRWASRSPLVWGLQALCVVGLLANVGLTPARWLQPDHAIEGALVRWAPIWALAGIATGWAAAHRASPLLARLESGADLAVRATLLAFGLGLSGLTWLGSALALGHVEVAVRASLVTAPLLAPALLGSRWVHRWAGIASAALILLGCLLLWPIPVEERAGWVAVALWSVGLALVAVAARPQALSPR